MSKTVIEPEFEDIDLAMVIPDRELSSPNAGCNMVETWPCTCGATTCGTTSQKPCHNCGN